MFNMQTDMISSLLDKPFSSRTFDEKREIVERGKPKPYMKDLTTVCKGGTKDSNTEIFQLQI